MFNTMTIGKMTGGIVIALVFLGFGNWAAGALYSTAGAVDEMQVAATEGEDATPAQEETAAGEAAAATETETVAAEEPAAAEPSFAEMVAAADIAKGEKTFGKCKACHKLEEGVNATGPSLFGVVGRDVGKAEGFRYSDGMASLGGQWTPERMGEFLTKPKNYVPGTKMSFAGLKKITDRANVIAYLATIGG